MNRSRYDSAGTVLLVDDDNDVRDAIAEVLEGEGFRVLRAVNGKDALRLLREGEPPDCVLFDLMMPVMDGWQFRLEQRRDPHLAAIPVVALSADQSARAQAVDADAFLEKPVDGRLLVRTVTDLVKAGRARKLEAERLAQTERLTTLGQLAAAVAHEINNPLSWVAGNLRIIANRLDNPETLAGRLDDTRAAVREALDGAQRIQAIVSDIRVFTRKVEDEATVVDLVEAVESVLRLLDRQLANRVRIVRDYGPVTKVKTSAGRMRQVLLNLIVNAVDALPEATPDFNEIRISLQPTDEGRVQVEVSDTGCGIPESILPRIFEPFFSTKAPGHGTGLGLFVSRTLVHAMGGELHVQSEVGRGTRFFFNLPAAQAEEAHAPSLRSLPPRPLTILVVDDEAGVGAALERQLQGHTVIRCTRGEEALEMLRSRDDIDVVLTDLYMPGMSGRSLYWELQRLGSGIEQRTIFMTAGILDEDTLQFAKSRSDRVLQKPVELSELEPLLARMALITPPRMAQRLAAMR